MADSTVSASMEASLRALEAAAKAGLTEQQNHRARLDDTIRSLLKRIVYRKNRKASTEFTLEALEAIAHCLEQRPASGGLKHPSYASAKDKRYWRNIMALWRRDPVIYEQALTPLLQYYKFRTDMEAVLYNKTRLDQGKTTIESQLLATKREQRYALLKWILLNHPGYRFDIDDSQRTMKLPNSVLFALHSVDSLHLFDRFEANYPGLLRFEADSLLKLDVELRTAMLRLFLQESSDGVFQHAQKHILHSRQMAEGRGSQAARAMWITAAFYFAVASRSLDLLEEVIIWARRFSRDPKTAIELYGFSRNSESPLQDERALRLLSGIPVSIPPDLSPTDIQSSVCRANEVILSLLDTAIQAQSEDSIDPDHWGNVKSLLKKVIQARLKWVDDLQYRLWLEDEDLLTCIWKDTISTLLKAEELGFLSENERLQLRDTNGLMQFSYIHSSDSLHDSASPATLRFIDELAKSRDDLWKRQRAVECPATSALQPPWPFGLPIQSLFPPHINLMPVRKGFKDENGASQPFPVSMPYLEKRAEDIVFVPPEHALSPPPAEDEAQAAIGRFIDDYSLALYIYVNLGGPHKWVRRLQDAWAHASQKLSGARMSASESITYWQEPFKNADLELPISNRFDLSLPTPIADSMDPIKWSPGPSDKVTDSARRLLDVLTIDCFTKPAPVRPGKAAGDCIKQCCPWVEAKGASLFWDVKAQRRAGYKCSRQTKEAFVAAALLLADGRSQAGCKLFSEPFSSPDSPQFPAMVLNGKLLESKEPSDKEVIDILECFKSAVPHELLEKLATSLVRKTLDDDTQSRTLRKWTTAILRLLARSKKPDTAANLIIDVVLRTPGETPWHRSILHVGNVRRVSNSKAKELLQKIVNDALQRLAAQPDENAATKMLAQLLKDVVFLGDDFVARSLFSIFSAAKGIYIRALVTASLGTVLASSSGQQCKQVIVDELEKHVVPVAAELDERAPMTKEQWIMAEEACQPPNVYESGLPPVCSALIDVVMNAHPEIVKSQGLVDKVLRPLLKKSRENNSAWVSIFLRKHNARHLAALLPRWPVWPQLLRLLLGRFTSRMTAAEFADLSHALLFSQFPNRIHNIVFFNNQLQENPELSKENDIKHWVQCMAGVQLPEVGISKVLLKAQFETANIASNQHLLTPRQLQKHEERVLRRLINDYGSDMQAWHRYLNYYKPPFHDNLSEEYLTNWRERCRPVLEFAVKLVESVRTPSWQNDPPRYPTILPENFEPSLWLLTYPSLYSPSPRDECLQILCAEIRRTIEKLVSSNFQYHTEYVILLAQIKANCALQDLMPVALNLGDLNLLGSMIPGTPSKLSEDLCIDAAFEILAHVGERDSRKSEDLQPARAMFESWKRCTKEEVRRKGVEFLAKLDGMGSVAGR